MSQDKHGSYATESATSMLVVNETGANIAFIVGTAPIHLTDETNVNKLYRVANYEEAVQYFGMDSNYGKYTLCEAIDVFLTKYKVAPIYMVNVLDPTKHKKAATAETNPLINMQMILSQTGAIKSTVKVTIDSKVKELNTDYTLAFNTDGLLVITALDDGTIKPTDSLTVAYDVLDSSKVKAADIIGTVDVNGAYSGIKLAQKVYPQFNEVIGNLLAPGWSQDITVSVELLSNAKGLNNTFTANAIVDLDTSKCKIYQDAVSVKQKSSLVDPLYNLCFGDVYLAGQKYNYSTWLAAIKQSIAANNDDFPNQSPSNKLLYSDGYKLNGVDLYLDREQGNYLNKNGIIVVRNSPAGWRSWGNKTACWPSDKDIRNFDIAVRDCFNFLKNTIVVTTDQMVDSQIDRALILRIEASVQGWLDGLIGSNKLIGAKVSFTKENNPTSELLAGNIYFSLTFTTGPTAGSITFNFSFNVNDLDKIFG